MKILAILTLIALAFPAYADEEVTVKATPLAPNLYMLEGDGGNMTALIGNDGTLLVDADFAPMAEKIVAKLRELKGDSPRFLVNTHFHYDHTGGNEIFGATATIMAASEVRDRLRTTQTLWKKQFPAAPAQAWPSLTFENSLTLHINDEETRIVHLPHGHTDGDSVVFFRNGKVASLGDLYFSGMYPIFHPEHRGSLEGYVRNIETVLAQLPEDAHVVPGHGPLGTKASLARYQQMIVASIATVKRALGAGHSLEQIQRAGLAKQWEPFSHGYLTTDQWLALLYRNLKK